MNNNDNNKNTNDFFEKNSKAIIECYYVQKNVGCYQDFTPIKLDTNSRNAKSKYDAQTYRRWKRAKKKAK